MCIIIHKPAGKYVPRRNLEYCFEQNPNGAGLMYPDGKNVHVIKGLYEDFEEFYEIYKKHEDKNLIIHFRVRTKGDISVDNAHPFLINNSLGFAHNGGIKTDTGHPTMSDTAMFNEAILKTLPNGWWKIPAILDLIAEYVGGSKLAFMRGSGEVFFVRKSTGKEKDGIWYSHGSFEPYVAPKHKSHYAQTQMGFAHYDTYGGMYDEDDIKLSDEVPKSACRICFQSFTYGAKPIRDKYGICPTCLGAFPSLCHPYESQFPGDFHKDECSKCKEPFSSILSKMELPTP